jgi:predicted dehydrogenase
MDKIRWGVISTADIGVATVIPAMQRGKYSEVSGISSRSLEKARAAAKRLGIPKAYGSYEELLADPEIDAVYNPLPNHLHVLWSVKALEAGKHVLCEKPIGMNAEDARRLLEVSKRYPNLKVMEAFMYRHHPQWQLARRLVREGAVGEVHAIQTIFNYYLVDPQNVRNMADIGGGGLMDVGCYAISVPRYIFEAEPLRVMATLDIDPQFKTDRIACAILEFAKGLATFTVSTQLDHFQRVSILGNQGILEVMIPFNPPTDRPTKVLVHNQDKVREFELEICDQYTLQGDFFSKAILEGTPVFTPLEDGVANMKVIDAVFSSAQAGGWVSV